MSDLILVTYATRYGSTQEVAEAIAATLRESGLEVDIQPMRKVQKLERFRAIVMGAPLYIGRWHKDAEKFLLLHRKPSRSGRWQFSRLAPLNRKRRIGDLYTPNSIENLQSSLGSPR